MVETGQRGNCLGPIRNKQAKLPRTGASTILAEEPAVFSIDWLKGAIPIEKEICTLATKDEAIAAAKTRAPDIAKRHSGREPDGFRLADAAGKILAIIPIRDSKR
jgi:hypothetical protein